MQIINLVDTLSKKNFGVWNPVVKISSYFENYIIIPFANPNDAYKIENCPIVSIHQIDDFINQNEENIFISHGCWSKATNYGHKAKMNNHYWLALPQGMLEPWSMRQKRLKKWVYFQLIERRKLKLADAIVAVSSSEKKNLQKLFPNQKVIHIPNGILAVPAVTKQEDKTRFLFMARLHHKKGIVPLVEAWIKSELMNSYLHELVVAGPDDGELEKLKAILTKSKCNNIRLVGAVYGNEKEELLKQSHFYILPSYSEGFPSSLLEAATHGCVPVYTEGCNFPEARKAEIGIFTNNSQKELTQLLNTLTKWNTAKIEQEGLKAKQFVDDNYRTEKIADLYKNLFLDLTNQPVN